MRSLTACVVAAGTILASAVVPAAAEIELGTLSVDPRGARFNVPVVYHCTLADLVGQRLTAEQLVKGSLELIEQPGGATRLPAQWDPVADLDPSPEAGALVFILSGKTPAKARRVFKLIYTDKAPKTPLAIEDRDTAHLRFTLGGKRVLRYNYGVVPFEKDKPGPHDRPCYIHPVWTPGGRVVTDDFPPDHRHQRGIFFAWVKTDVGGLHPDFWNLGSRTGRTTLDRVTGVVAGPVIAQMVSHNVLRAPQTPVLRELFVVRLWAVRADGWVFDVLVRHEPVDKPVVLKKHFYGGMAFRGAREWLDRKKMKMLTSEGNDRKKGNLQASTWVDTFGRIGDGEAGVVVFSFPSNLRHPQPNRLHPKVPYVGYVPAQRADYTIQPGQSLKLRYRFLIYDGKPDAARNRRMARDLAEPPATTWKPTP